MSKEAKLKLFRAVKLLCENFGLTEEQITYNLCARYSDVDDTDLRLLKKAYSWPDLMQEAKMHKDLPIEKKDEGLELGGCYNMSDLDPLAICKEDYSESSRIIEIDIADNCNIICIPDIHSPFHHPEWLAWAINYVYNISVKMPGLALYIIQLGDATDQYSSAKFDKVKQMNARFELETALKPLRKMWEIFIQLANTECFQLIGNHDTRLDRLIKKSNPELIDMLPRPKEILTFDGVMTTNTDRDKLKFNASKDSVMFEHGFLSTSKRHLDKNLENTVHAHLHTASLEFVNDKFVVYCGCGSDRDRFAFAYTNAIQKKNMKRGLGHIKVINGMLHPNFIQEGYNG